MTTDCPDCMGTGESFPCVTCRRCKGYGVIDQKQEAEAAVVTADRALTDLIGPAPTLDAPNIITIVEVYASLRDAVRRLDAQQPT